MLPSFLGVAVGDQLQGALDVGKQHRDLFALACQVAAGRQNLLGQVLGGVCLRSGESGRHDGSSANRLPAFEAEFGTCWQLGAALGARQPQTSAALQAKLRLRRIVLLALGALHTGAPLSRLRSNHGNAIRLCLLPGLLPRET